MQHSGLTLVSALSVAITGLLLINNYLNSFPLVLAFTLLILLINTDLSRHIKSNKLRAIQHGLWALSSTLLFITDQIPSSGYNGLFEGTAILLVVLMASIAKGSKFSTTVGLMFCAILTYSYGGGVVSAFMDSGWLAFAIAGTLTILGGSLLE